jgi:hypothetical protein
MLQETHWDVPCYVPTKTDIGCGKIIERRLILKEETTNWILSLQYT